MDVDHDVQTLAIHCQLSEGVKSEIQVPFHILSKPGFTFQAVSGQKSPSKEASEPLDAE